MNATLPPFAAWLAATVLPLGAAWLLFRAALKSERCFGYNRAVLLLAPLVAALLPLLPQPELPAWPAGDPGAAAVGPAGSANVSVLLPALEATGGVGATGWDGWPWLAALYGAGVALGLARLGWRLGQLRRAARGLPREEHEGYALLRTGGRLPTSSFGRTVFWDETADLSATEAASVLAHEQAHVRQGHTYDVLWLQVWRAVLWVNPFSHLLLPALRLTHELLADRAAARSAAPPTPTQPADAPYPALLARLTARRLAGPAYSTLLQPFTFSFTLTRIAMLQNQTPVRRWKQWLALPVLAGLVLVACQPESAQIEPVSAQSALSKDSSPAERQAWKEQVMRNVKKALWDDSLATGGRKAAGQNQELELAIRRDATVELALTNEPDSPPPPKLLDGSSKRFKVNFDHPDVIGTFGSQGKLSRAIIMGGISQFVEELAQKAGKPDKPEDLNKPKVYTYVEQMPELPTGGGNAAIVKAIQEKLAYPKPTAGRPAMEGRVFVSFTVGTDGVVRDGKIVKGLASLYDDAVLRAVQQLPRFEPGRQSGRAVAVSLTLPLTLEYDYTQIKPVVPGSVAQAGQAMKTGSGNGSPGGGEDYVLPEVPGGGGPDAWLDAIQANLIYPLARNGAPVRGIVPVRFEIGADGIVRNVELAYIPSSIYPSLGPAYEEAALAAVNKLPRFTPARQNGKAVAISPRMPLRFAK